MEQSKFFEAFMKQKKNPVYKSNSKSDKQFYFAIFSSSNGMYVKCVNKSLREKSINSEYYQGYTKDALDLYNNLKYKAKLIVDWNNPNSLIYLENNANLLDLLVRVDNLIDSKGNPIYCGLAEYPLILTISPNNELFNCELTICDSKIDKFLTEKHAIIGNRILSTNPLGANFKSVIELNTIIKTQDIEQYLSIVFSNFKNIKVNYQNYEVQNLGECELTPSLMIDNIDDSGYITINTSFSYRNYINPEFFYNFKPNKVVVINNNERGIEIYDLILPNMDILDNFVKILFYIESKYNISDSFNIEDDGVIINPELGHILFNSEIKTILENFSIFGDKFLKKNRLKKSTPNLELLFTSAIDYLQGSAALKIYGEEIPLYKAITSFETNGYIPLVDGSKGVVDRSYIDRIKKVIRQTKNGVEVSFFDLPYIEKELESSIKGDTFIKNLTSYKECKKKKNINIDLSNFNGSLRSYQKTGINWLLNLHKIGIAGCLSDDMGLGKTIQTLVFLQQVLIKDVDLPTLVVVPKSLIFNWIKEVQKFTPNLHTYTHYGDSRNINEISGNKLVFTTYHTLRNDIEDFKSKEFYYTILDEIQNIKNHTSLLAKSCFLIKSKYRLGISGTPIENSLSDLYSISRFLNPTLFGSFKRFKDEWSGPIVSEDSDIVKNILKSKIEPLFLRRLKEEVLDDLPPKTEQVLYVDMSEKQKSYYETVRKKYHDTIRLKIREDGIDKSQLTIIKAFMELRQIATIPEYKSEGILESPKKEFILDQLLETVEGGHKVLVFSNFLSAIKGLGESLDSYGVGYKTITGATTKRESIVEDFMDNPNTKVLIMTLKTGGVGLNLTAASYVYIMDPWWNIAAENQAIDRTHRIGQKNSVFCYRFIARDTIEEKILELHSKKRALFEHLFSRDKSVETKFSDQDIDYLLG